MRQGEGATPGQTTAQQQAYRARVRATKTIAVSPNLRASVSGRRTQIAPSLPVSADADPFGDAELYGDSDGLGTTPSGFYTSFPSGDDAKAVREALSPPSAEALPDGLPADDADPFEFDTLVKGKGKGPNRSYIIADTAGCSCEQIIEMQSLGGGHTKFGCSISAMDDWVELVNP